MKPGRGGFPSSLPPSFPPFKQRGRVSILTPGFALSLRGWGRVQVGGGERKLAFMSLLVLNLELDGLLHMCPPRSSYGTFPSPQKVPSSPHVPGFTQTPIDTEDMYLYDSYLSVCYIPDTGPGDQGTLVPQICCLPFWSLGGDRQYTKKC